MSRMEKAVDEMAAYVCDKVCRYGTDVSLDLKRLDGICAECEMGDHVCRILNEHTRGVKNRVGQRSISWTDMVMDRFSRVL